MTVPANISPFGRWLTRVAPIEPEETRAVLAAFGLFFFMWAGYFAVRPLRDTIGTIIGRDATANLWMVTWAASLLDQGFATPPDTKGTGIKLPDIAVSPYATRVAQRAGFVQLARGATATVPLVTPTTTEPAKSEQPTAAATTTAVTKDDGGGLLTLSNVLLVLVVVLFVAVLLRRRAVKRQRARRIARQRARAKALRSGSLPVVDGRYRTGQRLGPPVESQVRVKRGPDYIDLTTDEPVRSTGRGRGRRSR